MIYCSLEPGLVDLAELQPHDTDIAFSVVNSLLLHRKMILRFGAKIPVTDEFIALVISDLDRVPIRNPPLQRNLRELILEILARQVKPSLVPAGLDNTRLSPSIVSPWIPDNLREIWLDTLVAAVTDLLQSSKEHQLTIATWYRIELPNEAILSNQALIDFSADRKTDWGIRVLSMGHDWQVVHAIASEWPQGIEVLVENYAGKVLSVPVDSIEVRRCFRFERSCLHAIADEDDPGIRERIVEVVARRAYDRLERRQNNELIDGERGTWRVYVKKMTPPVRLHYNFDGDQIVYTLYTNGDHDKGLPK